MHATNATTPARRIAALEPTARVPRLEARACFGRKMGYLMANIFQTRIYYILDQPAMALSSICG
jgi:hypothetical protein